MLMEVSAYFILNFFMLPYLQRVGENNANRQKKKNA